MASSTIQDLVAMWPMPRRGGWRHHLLGIYHALHLAPRLRGWLRHGSQRPRFDLFNHFFREFIPKKEVFWIYWTNLPILTIKSLPSHIACHDSLDPLFQNLGDLDSRLGGCGTRVVSDFFSNLLEDNDRRLKNELTLSLILRVNLRLEGYSI
jgi:hypothetical protein